MNVNVKWLEAFKNLPYEKKEELFNALAEKLDKAKENPADAKVARIEKGLTRALTKSWHNTSTKAVNKALKVIPKNDKRFSQKMADKVLASLTKSYKGVEKKTEKRVSNDMEEIYKVNKVGFGKQFKLSSSDEKSKQLIFMGKRLDPLTKEVVPYNSIVQSIDHIERFKKSGRKLEDILKAVEFGTLDTEAYDNLARLENVAIGDHFPATLKGRVSSAIQEGVLEKGLTNADAGAFLQQRITEILGGNVAGALPASVAQGQASTTAYFEMLTATNTTFSRSFSQMNLMWEAGITRWQFAAVLDRITSVVCEQMDGRVFTIEQGMAHQKAVLDAENVEALKGIAPFTRNLNAFGLKAGQKLDNAKTSAALADAGVSVPPLHGKCRSEVHPL